MLSHKFNVVGGNHLPSNVRLDVASSDDHQVIIAPTRREAREQPFYANYATGVDYEAEKALRHRENHPAILAQSSVALLNGGRVITEGSFVADAANNLFSDSFRAYGMVERFGFADLGNRAYEITVPEQQEDVDCPVAVIGGQTNKNYFHWLIESLSRVLLTEKALNSNSFKVLVPPMAPWMAAALEVVGVDRERVIAVRPGLTSYPKLLFPSRGLGTIAQLSWQSLSLMDMFLGKARETQSPVKAKRLYVSRAGSASRRIANEAEVIDTLKQHDVEVVFPEKYSLLGQVALFRDAELVVGALGAGLTNIAFQPEGAAIIELAPALRTGDANLFANLAHWRRLRYGLLVCPQVSGDERPADRRDFHVDAAELRAALACVL